jgi:hypothetical protein
VNKIDPNQEQEPKKNKLFEEIINGKGGNKSAIARVLGDVSPQLIGQYIAGRQKPKEEFFKKWDVAYKEDIRWVFETNVSHENPKDRHIAKRHEIKKLGDAKNGIMVYESAPVYASVKTVYHDEHAVPDYVLNIPQFRDCNYGTRASGDSMYPEIRNGDLIVCKELAVDARIIYGDIYVIHTKDGIETIKYVQQFTDGSDGDPWVLLVPHNKGAGMGTPIPRKEIIKLFKVRAVFKAY